MPDTRSPEYAERLATLPEARWKQILDVQRPYRWNLRRLELGRVLDVGCGVGRNLAHLDPRSVGVDHNAACVAEARRRGLTAHTADGFADSPDAVPESFDSLLLAHVLEHVARADAPGLLAEYVPYVSPGGRVVLITPQERGYATDATHVHFADFDQVAAHARAAGLVIERAYSFPFPRAAGRVFAYNEFVTVARRASG